ncbi:MAG TPA: ABC transporter permease subunit [Streptosporangiaceae bacterium]|nr:ABC transporter permease subunit [Streptosporangiaceae bacterium]
MTALAGPAPLPWRRMAWVTWRHHRVALAGVATLLGVLAVYLWVAGLQLHHAYAVATACQPASSVACQNMMENFDGSYSSPAQTIVALLHVVPVLIGAFVGAPVLARELETGTFRYAWTLGFGRWRWTLAKLVPLAIVVAAAAGVFSLLFSWYFQPFFAEGSRIPLDPELFGLRGVAFAAWTLAAFATGALAGMLIRRVVPAIAATLAVYAGLVLTTDLYLQQHYARPVVTSQLNVPADAWIMSQWWTRSGTTVSQGTMNQVIQSTFERIAPVVHSRAQKTRVVTVDLPHYLTQHGYTSWTRYQPGSRFWLFQWIEGGWLLALSVLLIATTVWLVRRRAA